MRPETNPIATMRPAKASAPQRTVEDVAADWIETDVDPSPGGHGEHVMTQILTQIVHGEVDGVVGAVIEGELALVLGDVAGDDDRALGLGDLDRGQPDAAGRAVDKHGFAGLVLATEHQGDMRGGVDGAQAGGGGEVHGIGDKDGNVPAGRPTARHRLPTGPGRRRGRRA